MENIGIVDQSLFLNLLCILWYPCVDRGPTYPSSWGL